MAEFELTADTTDEDLWERGAERILLLGNHYDVKAQANPIRETEDFNPDSRPVTYTIESLVVQVEEDQQKGLRRALIKGVDDGSVRVRDLMKAIRWIGERREEAEERLTARQTGRPTSGQSHSTP